MITITSSSMTGISTSSSNISSTTTSNVASTTLSMVSTSTYSSTIDASANNAQEQAVQLIPRALVGSSGSRAQIMNKIAGHGTTLNMNVLLQLSLYTPLTHIYNAESIFLSFA